MAGILGNRAGKAMSSEIVWLAGASRDVERLKNFIKPKSPQVAQRAARRIIQGVMILRDNPGAGKPVENMVNYRDLTLGFGSGDYIVRYREDGQRIVIIRVRHSREKGF